MLPPYNQIQFRAGNLRTRRRIKRETLNVKVREWMAGLSIQHLYVLRFTFYAQSRSCTRPTKMIDIHAHTTASDGSLTPTQLVQLAVETGLSTLGITDHDTVGGLAEGETAAGEAGIHFVPGIELSVDYKPGQFHLLGYFLDYRSRPFLDR